MYDTDADIRREYEQREFNVCCKHCSLKATSPQRNLQNAGWRLTPKYEICRECVIELAYQSTIRESIFC